MSEGNGEEKESAFFASHFCPLVPATNGNALSDFCKKMGDKKIIEHNANRNSFQEASISGRSLIRENQYLFVSHFFDGSFVLERAQLSGALSHSSHSWP